MTNGKYIHNYLFSKPQELSDIAPGSQTPFLMYDGQVLTDNFEIEDFLESRLQPPKWVDFFLFWNWWNKYRYPSLAAQNPESLLAGSDIFQKFSAFIKASPGSSNYDSKFKIRTPLSVQKKKSRTENDNYFKGPILTIIALQQRFANSLLKFDAFLKTSIGGQTDRLFIDSNKLSLADCNVLPKLHIAIVASKALRNFDILQVLLKIFK